MELIDREELLKDLKTSAIYHANNSREETLMYRDRNIVREQPTVEATPKDQYEARLIELRSMALRVKHNTGSIDTLIDKLDDLLGEVKE